DMIAKDSFPMYTLFIDLDPSRLDINVHPTKQEIKFEDEKIIYAFVQSAVKHALAQYSVTPTLDFELDNTIQHTDAVSKPFTSEKQYTATGSSLYKTFTQKNQAHFINSKSDLEPWTDPSIAQKTDNEIPSSLKAIDEEAKRNEHNYPSFLKEVHLAKKNKRPSSEEFLQVHKTFVIAQNENGFIVIHQQNAHERILYERFVNAMKGKPIAIQRSLFPVTLELTPADSVLLNDLLPDLFLLGYHAEPFGNNTFVIQGSPADVTDGNEKVAIEKMLEQYKHFSMDVTFSKREKLLRSMAWQQSVKAGTYLSRDEVKVLVEDLFTCEINNTTPNGKPVFLEFKKEELGKMFGR
ncbi:MAG: DNA mismatch repair protein MutL, partial [Bacteroidota bacterium]|nr:DNA mismatch repair protein MutL [Bacteroidota bacterium]